MPFDHKFERQSFLNRDNNSLACYVSPKKQKKLSASYYDRKLVNDSIYGSLTFEKDMHFKISLALEKSCSVNLYLFRNKIRNRLQGS